MDNYLLRFFGIFVLVITLQLFIFNNIQLSGYINPYIYIAFILFLPYSTPRWLLLILGFFIGLTLDSFMNTYGMHSTATTFMAFVRPFVLSILSDREDVDKKGIPTINSNSFTWFIKYVIVLVLAHHLVLFFTESFSFFNFFLTIWRVILSTIATSGLIIIAQLFTLRK
jgi:hypothetical protein